MKYSYLLCLLLLSASLCKAQNDTVSSAKLKVHFTIQVKQEQSPISPYVYGTNGQSEDSDENITARRLGGSRMTAYNWENNASHAGRSWENFSDDYLAHELRIEPFRRDEPAVVLTSFHDTSLAMNCYSLLTLQMAGYVAKDKYGVVSEREIAPSYRWVQVKPFKNAKFTITPEAEDYYVYMDEEVNYLVTKYGNASQLRGVKGYALDNEPELWSSIHPRVHPKETKCGELLSKSIPLAYAVKKVDPYAEIFGPGLYGFTAFKNLHNAPDWSDYFDKGYKTFIDLYLAEMKKASDSLGVRLLDVLSVHWYPEAQGMNDKGQWERVAYFGGTDRGVAEARMQAPRSLWDSTYSENSYIAKYFGPANLIPKLKASIDRNYKGTKLAIVEYNYGAQDHISGGIAQADVLGIYGKYGVYMANYWGEVKGYASAGFKIYRNYDGFHSTYGDTKVKAVTSDIENTSVYASVNKTSKKKELHIIAINKNYDKTVTASFKIGGGNYGKGRVWGFDSKSPLIKEFKNIPALKGGELVYEIPPLTVVHIVLKPAKEEAEE